LQQVQQLVVVLVKRHKVLVLVLVLFCQVKEDVELLLEVLGKLFEFLLGILLVFVLVVLVVEVEEVVVVV
jgi:hypothetical protein